MALREHRCVRCGHGQLVFDGEEHRLRQGNCGRLLRWCHDYRIMPPTPTVVHTTDTWMSEPHLDSFESTYELDRILNIEVREAKEMQMFNEVRRNL